MTYVPNTCPECGASLDPGERCDCEFYGDPEQGMCSGCPNGHNCNSCRAVDTGE